MSHLRTTLPTLAALALCAALAPFVAGSSCGSRSIEDTPDAGNGDSNLISCGSVEDCPNATEYDCLGVCLKKCSTVNEVCAAGEYCDTNGYCATGCRDSSSCGEGKVCLAGQCQDGQGASCSSKCDCQAGQICTAGTCVPASESCQTAADCPRGPASPTDRCEAYQCNGFSHLCFDPAPTPCNSPADCTGRPGCLNGNCICSSTQNCVPNIPCTVADEATTCGAGNFCNATAGGTGTCDALPSCAQDSECTAVLAGLVCNVGSQLCERPQSCTTTTDCTTAPRLYCDTTNSVCSTPNCLNGGAPCSGTLVCGASGSCVQQGTGAPCTDDTGCPTDQYCNTQLATAQCAFGCRSSSDCNGLSCNGHVCESGGASGGFGDACDGADPTSCTTPLICGFITSTCAEACAAPEDCVACNARFGGTCTCNGLGFCQAG